MNNDWIQLGSGGNSTSTCESWAQGHGALPQLGHVAHTRHSHSWGHWVLRWVRPAEHLAGSDSELGEPGAISDGPTASHQSMWSVRRFKRLTHEARTAS